MQFNRTTRDQKGQRSTMGNGTDRRHDDGQPDIMSGLVWVGSSLITHEEHAANVLAVLEENARHILRALCSLGNTLGWPSWANDLRQKAIQLGSALEDAQMEIEADMMPPCQGGQF